MRAVTTFVPSALAMGAVTLTVFEAADADGEDAAVESPFEPLSACEAATGIVMTSATAAVVRVSMRRLLKITYFHPEGGGHRSGACAYNETVCIVSALRERLSIRGRSTSTRGRWNRPKPTHIVKKQVWIRRRRLRLTMSLQVTLVVRLLTSPGRSGCKAMINLRTKRQTPGCSDRGKGDRNEHKPQISCQEKLIS